MKKLLLIALFALACRNESADLSTTTAPADTSGTTSVSATTTGSTGGTVSAMSPADKEFVIKAAQGGMAEVNAGQMASQKGRHADVKAFGNRMVQDHGKGNEELKQLATMKGLALPVEPAEEQKKAAEHMASLSGAAFDKAYMMHMVEDHEKAVADFDKASREAQDADLKAWATKTLPTLQDHLRVAKETQRKLR